MANRKETINKVMNTENMISLTLPEGLKAGSVIRLLIQDGNPQIVVDETAEEIRRSGYVGNKRLFRRWIMAMMFKMLEYDCQYYDKHGFDGYLTMNYDYTYQFRVLQDEVNAIAKMESEGDPEAEIRKSFWSKYIIATTMTYYVKKAKEYVRGRYNASRRMYYDCAHNWYTWDVLLNTTKRLTGYADLVINANNYTEVKFWLKKFVNEMIPLHKGFIKGTAQRTISMCPEWKSAFKGAGAYYTLQNLIRFHGVRVKAALPCPCFCPLTLAESELILEKKRQEYSGVDGYRLFAFMKEVIDYNNFDFHKRMRELRNR